MEYNIIVKINKQMNTHKEYWVEWNKLQTIKKKIQNKKNNKKQALLSM